jgi:RND family efflux transporter MFP subunit
LVWGIALAAVVVGMTVLVRHRAAAPVPVSTTTVQRGRVRDFVTSVAAGRVAARKEVTLRAEIAGKVLKLHKRRGDVVQAGEPLLTYDAEELRDRLRVASAAVNVARAQVLQVEQNAANVEINLARARRLRETGSIPQAQLDDLDGQQKAAVRSIEAARAALFQAGANVELSRTALTKTVVLAPFAGTVLSTTIEEGEVTAPATPIIQLADTTELHVDAEIDEADLGRVKLGMPADVVLDALPGERIRGVVRELAPSVTRDNRGDRSVAFEVALPRDERLRVGMSADVDVIVDVRDNALFVAPNAVQGRGAERAVFVVVAGRAHRRVVDVGISTWEAVEIRGGLAEGDVVVASLSSSQLTDGAAVEPTR